MSGFGCSRCGEAYAGKCACSPRERKRFRVHFEIRGNSYRDIDADTEQEARDECEGDMLFMQDFELATVSNISVEHVELVKTAKTEKKKIARPSRRAKK